MNIWTHTDFQRGGELEDFWTKAIKFVILPLGYYEPVQRQATGWTAGVRCQARTTYFSLVHRVQTGSEAHPASYPMGAGSSFSNGNAAGVWS
jgi:hypothetical protein